MIPNDYPKSGIEERWRDSHVNQKGTGVNPFVNKPYKDLKVLKTIKMVPPPANMTRESVLEFHKKNKNKM